MMVVFVFVFLIVVGVLLVFLCGVECCVLVVVEL